MPTLKAYTVYLVSKTGAKDKLFVLAYDEKEARNKADYLVDNKIWDVESIEFGINKK